MSVQGNRGFDCNVALIDEANYSPDSLLLQSIFPTLIMQSVACIMITTPANPDSLFMRLVTHCDDNGNPLMPVIWLGQPCDDCQARKVPLQCKHTWYHAPAWKDPERQARLAPLWAFADETNARENFALSSVRTAVGFTSEMIKSVAESPPYDDRRHRPHFVYLAADPATGGQSDFGLTAGYMVDNTFVILFADGNRLDPSHVVVDEAQRMVGAVERIRGIPGLHSIPIVFIPEGAPGTAASYLWSHISHMTPIMVLEEVGERGGIKRVGVPKTAPSTSEMYTLFADYVAAGCVRFSSRFVSLPRAGTDGTATARGKIVEQMARYRPDIKKKYGEDNNDDLLIALMMIPYWREFMWKQSRYREWIKRYGTGAGELPL